MDKSKSKIIVVDDEPDIVEFLNIILQEEGYEVFTTDNVEELERLCKEQQPDLILLDLLLSGKDGREIVRDLKADPELQSIPVILLSAHPSAEESARTSGADDFLAKPFEMDDLLLKVQLYSQGDDTPPPPEPEP